MSSLDTALSSVKEANAASEKSVPDRKDAQITKSLKIEAAVSGWSSQPS
jgi:hypothetical protein